MDLLGNIAAPGQITATAILNDSLKNTGASAQNLSFNVHLKDVGFGAVEMYDAANEQLNGSYRMGFSADIFLNGQLVWHSMQGATMINGLVERQHEGAFSGNMAMERESNSAYFRMDDFQTRVALGQLAPGATANVSYRLSVFSYWDDPDSCFYECSNMGSGLRDPAGLEAQRLQLSPVPEADTWAMLAGGLALLGWVARRRRQA